MLQELQLDDWEIKPDEIEIMRSPDGSLCQLGAGAFGQVCSFTLSCWCAFSSRMTLQWSKWSVADGTLCLASDREPVVTGKS